MGKELNSRDTQTLRPKSSSGKLVIWDSITTVRALGTMDPDAPCSSTRISGSSLCVPTNSRGGGPMLLSRGSLVWALNRVLGYLFVSHLSSLSLVCYALAVSQLVDCIGLDFVGALSVGFVLRFGSGRGVAWCLCIRACWVFHLGMLWWLVFLHSIWAGPLRCWVFELVGPRGVCSLHISCSISLT